MDSVAVNGWKNLTAERMRNSTNYIHFAAAEAWGALTSYHALENMQALGNNQIRPRPEFKPAKFDSKYYDDIKAKDISWQEPQRKKSKYGSRGR